MLDSDSFRDEVEDFSSRLKDEDFQSILKILGQEYPVERTRVYALTVYDCRKGIHKLDRSKQHRVIIYLDSSELLIERIEYVCP